jgi:PAS domain S-box-containing protein
MLDNKYILTFEDIEYASQIPSIKKQIVERPTPTYVQSPYINIKPIKSIVGSLKNINLGRKIVDHAPKIHMPVLKHETKELYNEWTEVETPEKELREEHTDEIMDLEEELNLTFDEDLEDISDIIKGKLDRIDKEIKDFREKKEDIQSKKIEKVKVENRKKNQKISKILDKTSGTAAVIKNGIFKEIDSSFEKLLGYDKEEILNKHLIDFVCTEGLSGVEDYYFRKINHESDLSFETVVLTKDNKKLAIKVNIKPTFIDGEKAEIAEISVIKNLKKQT